jgi:hypothetical protein
VASDNPGTIGVDGRPEGYAIFTANTQLMLPDMPRLDGKQPRGRSTGPDVAVAGMGGKGALIALGGFALITFLILGRKKKS